MNNDFTDIESLLSENSIIFTKYGKNVSTGWLGIECPFCEDSSNHLGINISGGGFSCWRCGEKGNLTTLLKTLLNINGKQARKTIKDYETSFIPTEEKTHSTYVNLPIEATTHPENIHLAYLRSRNIKDIPQIISKFDLRFTYITNELPYRVIIPVYENRRLVTYTSRDATGRAPIRYKTLPAEKSIKSITDCLYAYDLTKKYSDVLLLEGCADVWRMSEVLPSINVLGLFGSRLSQSQISKLLFLEPKRVIVALDGEEDMELKASKIANQVNGFGIETNVLYLDDGEDPATIKNIDELRSLIS